MMEQSICRIINISTNILLLESQSNKFGSEKLIVTLRSFQTKQIEALQV